MVRPEPPGRAAAVQAPAAPKSPTIFGLTAAWFRVHRLGDTANRNMFYGSNRTFCTDSRVKVERNSRMTP